jgi:hypothetical protein
MSVFCCLAANAQFSYSNSLVGATLIYSNNFTLGTPGVNISNTAPTVANSTFGGTSTATWTDVLGFHDTNSSGPVFFAANGAVPGTPDSMLLPFTPQPNFVYTLTASVSFSGNPGNWVGTGFAQRIPINANFGFGRMSDGGSTPPNQGPNGFDWIILTESSGNVQFFKGAGAGNQLISQNGFFPAGAGTHAVKVILDTTGSPWTVAAFVDNVQAATNSAYSSNPSIGAVGLTENTLGAPANVQWNTFALSATPIVIGQQPASANVSAGAAFTNKVLVAATSPSYQWYTNDVAIAGATNASLIINPVSVGDAGTNYYVVVTNVYGAVTSAPASLTVYTNPVIIAQSPTTHTNPMTLFGGMNLDGNNYLGSSPTFSVSALGAIPLSFQWLTNGVAVSGATKASFTFTNCQFGGPTNFACVVSNSFGTATNTWPIVVYAPTPTAPYRQAIMAAQPVGFWRLNEPDNNLNNGNPGAICNEYQSGNNGIYTNVALGQTGYNPLEPEETSAWFGQGGLFYCFANQIQGLDFAAPAGANAQFTVEAWANCGSSGIGGGGPVVTQGTNGANEAFALGLDTSATPNYQFYVRSANGTVYKADSSIQATDFAWHHLVGVCDEAAGKVSLYVDGKLAASTAIPVQSGLFEAAVPISIGGEYKSGTGNNLQFFGFIDDVAAYGYALSAAQVAGHYSAVGNLIPLSFVSPLAPTNLVYQVNKTLTIPATVFGQPPFGYYWTNITTGGVLGSGKTNVLATLDATLTFPNASASLSGDQLELVATNGGGSTNWFVSLFTPPPPVTLDYSNPILYSNYFNGGTWSIAGMPMTAANSLVGGTNTTWTDALGTNDTGSLQANGVSATTSPDSWVVPFTPHSGYIYTVTASVTFSGNPGNWVGVGFAQRVPTNAAVGFGRFSDGGTTPPNQGPNGYDWMILTEGSGNLQCFTGPAGTGQVFNQNGFFPAGPGSHVVQVILDTTGPLWSAAFYVDGVQAGTTQTYAANPPIGAVGITQTTLSAPGFVQWNYFALSQEAPGGVPPYLFAPLPPGNVTLLADTSLSIPVSAFGSVPLGYYWSNTNTDALLGAGITNDVAPLVANLGVSDVPFSWNGNTLALIVTNAFGTNISLVSLTVTNTINPKPGPIQFSFAAGLLTLSWPTNMGWTLQAQTNSPGVGLGTNWVVVPGSTTITNLVVPVNPTNGSVFYRLRM